MNIEDFNKWKEVIEEGDVNSAECLLWDMESRIDVLQDEIDQLQDKADELREEIAKAPDDEHIYRSGLWIKRLGYE